MNNHIDRQTLHLSLLQSLATYVQRWREPLVLNSIFLISSTVFGSILGFLFWILAARVIDPVGLGIGAAYVSTMGLVAKLSGMGIGPTIIRFTPSLKGNRIAFVNTGLTVVFISTGVISVLFSAYMLFFSSDLVSSSHPYLYLLLFITSTLFFNLGQVSDRLYIAFEAAHLLLIRNQLALILRIIILLSLGSNYGAVGIIVAVCIGESTTLLLSGVFLAPKVIDSYRFKLQFSWAIIIEKVKYSIGNYFAQLLWLATPLVYPLMIVSLIGAEANAYFYICWSIVNALLIVPTAVSTATFAHASQDSKTRQKRSQRIMLITTTCLAPIVLILIAGSGRILGIFSEEYAITGTRLLQMLLLSTLPYTINTFAITDYRICQKIRPMLLVSGSIAVLSLTLSAVLSSRYGLIGIGQGWLLGQALGVPISFVPKYFRETQ